MPDEENLELQKIPEPDDDVSGESAEVEGAEAEPVEAETPGESSDEEPELVEAVSEDAELEAVEVAASELSAEAQPDAPPEADAQPDVEAPEPQGDPGISVERPNMNWYIIHTYSGFEQKVKESLRGRSQAFGFAEQIGEILIPQEEVVEMRSGKKVTSKRLLYPGYVLVQMEMNETLWHAVKDTPRVTGFVGGGNSPVPLSADEVNSILFRQASSAERPRPKLTFEKGEQVRINDGPFTNFTGKVDEVNMERDTLRVLVTIFGRATPVELDFLQVEKVS